MKLLKMQPTFTLDVPISAEDAVARIRHAIATPELSGHALSAGKCVEFTVDAADQRFWSPHLSIQLSDTPSGSQLHGRFSPRPEIWTMFMAIYAIVTIIMFGASVYAYVQWFLGSTPWTLAIVPAGLLIIAGLHMASLIGQNLSADQMELLRARLDRALEIAFDEQSCPV